MVSIMLNTAGEESRTNPKRFSDSNLTYLPMQFLIEESITVFNRGTHNVCVPYLEHQYRYSDAHRQRPRQDKTAHPDVSIPYGFALS